MMTMMPKEEEEEEVSEQCLIVILVISSVLVFLLKGQQARLFEGTLRGLPEVRFRLPLAGGL